MQSEKWLFGIVGVLLGIGGTLFAMHFLIAANAYDPTSMYRVEAAGTNVSCLSVASVQAVCNVSREIIDMQSYLSYDKGYKEAEARCNS